MEKVLAASDGISRRVSRPIFASLGIKDFSSQSLRLQVSVTSYCLETLDAATIWLHSTSAI